MQTNLSGRNNFWIIITITVAGFIMWVGGLLCATHVAWAAGASSSS